MKRASVALLVLLLTTAASGKSTHRLRRGEDIFTPTGKPLPHSHKSVGRTVPMTGGTLTLGAFFVDVTVGTGAGAANFAAVVDTGSSNTAIPGAGCGFACMSLTTYNTSASPTSKPVLQDDAACQNCRPTELGQGAVIEADPTNCLYGPGKSALPQSDQCAFSVSYGGSSSGISGFVSQDQVCLGGATGACARDAFVGSILQEYPSGTLSAGIVGLAYPANACNPTCQPTLLDSLVASGALAKDENKFGMCLTKSNGGVLDLGYFNKSRAQGEFEWANVTVEHWYNINVTGMYAGKFKIDVPPFLFEVRNDAIGSFVDSGTSILLMSPFAFQQLIQSVYTNYGSIEGVTSFFDGAQQSCYTFQNASAIAQYPRIEFSILGSDGKEFRVGLDATDYLLPQPVANGYCLGIAGTPSLGVIFGDVLMQRYYIAFDRVGRKLGFAPVANCEA